MSKSMTEQPSMKAKDLTDKVVIRGMIADGRMSGEWKECPCGYFYQGARCPDLKCTKWKALNGKATVKCYLHGDSESGRDAMEKLGLRGEPLNLAADWGYEVEFEVEVDLATGNTKILSCDGHKLQY